MTGMPVPDFIVELRRKVGRDLLWLPAVTAVVFDGDGPDGRVLLVRRSDTGEWTPIGGILEPGEQPAHGAEREVLEETGVTARVQRLVAVAATPPGAYGNGDRVQFLDLTFRCERVAGRAAVGDDESLEVGWFARDALPPMREEWRRSIDLAAPAEGEVLFHR